MTVKTNNHQQEFFNELTKQFSRKADMISAIGNILKVGRDAVYRRLRGDTVLSANELINLARHFSISLDPKTRHDIPHMHYPDGAVNATSEVDFYRQVLDRSEVLLHLDNVEIDYATPELPLFYGLYSPVLLAYKTYVYGLTTWNLDKWKGENFHPNLVDPEVQQIADRLMNVFYALPAREMWSVSILDITLQEIEHGVSVGYLDDKDLIETMFAELNETINHMEAMTKAGKRFPPNGTYTDESPGFRVYHNELTNTNNVIIIKTPIQSTVYTTFVNPNFLFSHDERVLNQIQTWFNNLVESSNVMNADTAKYTNAYFNKLRRKVEEAKLRIKVLSGLF